ncbi:hypothetical protein [Luteimonas vadosa]|uniref:Uncharacterized protein n=1 Tax=Luteimonas vadosa TaxID=1165507 RepID=A0ABP9EAH8_9GAMM
MRLRGWLTLAVLIAAVGWWFSPASPRVPAMARAATPGQVHCPLPPRVAVGAVPLQSAPPSSLPAFQLQAATLQPLAGMSIEARVLARRDYRFDREARLSPTDLALGWQRMGDPAVLSRLHVSQAARWYRYRWEGTPPLPPAEIAGSSANMHMIPSDDATARALSRLREGDRVRIDGWLVEAAAPDGWRWRSSLSRDDEGSGACEVVYVCAITPL